jgi:cobalt-zinc-cadmium efflux system outer membrane protein
MLQCSVSFESGPRKGGVSRSQGWGWFRARVGTRAVRIVATLDNDDSVARRCFLSRRIFFFWFMTLLLAAESAHALTLAEAEAQLVANNRELQAARRAISSAEAQQLIAGERPNATFSVNSSSIGSNPGVGAGALDQKRVDTVFRIDQPFERGDKRELRLDAASGLQRAALNDSLDVLRQQLAAVRGAYYDLKQAQERVTVLGESAQLFAGTLSAAQARLKAGDLAPADVAKVQVDFERAQNDSRGALADLTRARLALAYMIGMESAAAQLQATDPWPALERADPGAVEDAIEARPDVLAASSRVEAAEKFRDLAKAQRTHDVTVGAQFERFPGSLPTNSVGFGVSIPLFTGSDFSGEIRKAEVDRYTALDAAARARAIAVTELRRAASDLNAAAERVERYEGSLLDAAGRSAQAAEFAFQRGAISVLEVLDARRTLRAVQVEAVAARADYSKALAAWRASGSSAESLAQKELTR